MARKALVVSVIAAATVALLLAAVALRQGSAIAQPIAGATYTDTVSGGGTVESTVSAARSRPTRTPTPVVPGEWVRHTTARIQIDLPETWEAWDPSEEALEAILEELGGLDPEFAALVEEMLTAEPFEFFAFDTESVEFVNNLNIGSEESLFPTTVSALLWQLEMFYSLFGLTVLETDSDLTIGGMKAGSIQTEMVVDSYTLRQVQYIVLPEPTLVFYLTFSASADDFDALESVFEQIAESFRVLESPTPIPSPTPTPTPTPTPSLTPGQMHNCPEAGKWSIAIWSGQDATPISDALAFCPQQVDVAYRIDPDTQAWTRYFRGRPEISNLTALDDCQGVIALGAGVSAASTAGDEPLRAMASGMLGCPQPGKWAIAVWDGDDGTDAEQAFATCGEEAVAVAYSIDPDTQAWSRYFRGRPEISNLTALNNMQGVMALGGTQAPAPAAGPLKIGVLVPYTGFLSDFGVAFDRSARLAVKEINEAGGVLGQDVVLVTGDSGTDPVKAQQEARRLIDIEKVSAIIGAAASGVTLPVAEAVAIPSGILQISPSAASPALTVVDDDDFLFRTTISDAAQGSVLAHLADDLAFTSACTVYVNNAYGQGISELFADTFEELDGTVTAQVSHATEEQLSYLSELNQCVEGGPDVLAAISYPEHGRVFLKEALEAELIDTFIFVDGTKSDTMFGELGWDNFEGMYGTEPGSLEVAPGTAFDNAYEAQYGEQPTVPFMRETYDAVYVIALAAEKAGSTDSTAIRNALRDIANPPGEVVNPGVEGFETALTLIAAGTAIDYQGAAGPIDFDSNGDVLQGAIEIWQISGGEIVEAVRTFAVDLSTTPPTVTEVTE